MCGFALEFVRTLSAFDAIQSRYIHRLPFRTMRTNRIESESDYQIESDCIG